MLAHLSVHNVVDNLFVQGMVLQVGLWLTLAQIRLKSKNDWSTVLSALQSLPISEANRREVKRFVKFAMVGTAGMITHLTIWPTSLTLGLHFPDALANAIGFVVAVVQNYFLNYRWTFGDRRYTTTKSRWLQVSQFAIVSVVGLGINAIVREIVSYIMHPIWLSLLPDVMVAEVINYNFSIAAAIGVVLFWNFAINRLWTFRNT